MLTVLAGLGWLLGACAAERVPESYAPSESHSNYREAISELGLADSEAGQRWIETASDALSSAVEVRPPFREEVYLDPMEVEAAAFEFPAPQGQRVTITIDTSRRRYFADVFRVADSMQGERLEAPDLVASASGEGTVVFEPRRSGRYLLRIQPELLVGGRFVVTVAADAAYAFPVPDAGPERILSVFGDPRDGGSRSHHGVDVFAERGTDVVAVTPARVARVGRRDRGGNIVTLLDESRGLAIYYAHLDERMAVEGRQVPRGETIGTVGNTGNAQSTHPHLHIGIYDGSWRRPVDPWYFFVPADTNPPALEASVWESGSVVRVTEGASVLSHPPGRWGTRPSPARADARGDELDDDPAALQVLEEGEPLPYDGGSVLFVDGRQAGYVRVRTPDGRIGYVESGQTELVEEPLDTLTVAGRRYLRNAPTATAPVVGEVAPRRTVGILGSFGQYRLIRTEDGERAWLWTPGLVS